MRNLILILFLIVLIACGKEEPKGPEIPVYMYEKSINRCYQINEIHYIRVKGIYDSHYFVAYLGKTAASKLKESYYGIIHGNEDDFLNYEIRCNKVVLEL